MANTRYNTLKIKKDLVPEFKSVNLVLNIDEIEQSISEVLGDKGTVVIWLMNRIVWTYFRDGHIVLDEEAVSLEFWQEMRAFNEMAEVHLVRNGDVLYGRSVIDKTEDSGWDKGYVDTIAPLWGVKGDIACPQGYVELEDAKRKLNLKIPCEDGSFTKYGLITRSYIKADSVTGLSGYVDYRYYAIEGMEV